MAKYNRKKITKLRKSHIGLSITVLILISFMGTVLLAMLVSFVATFLVNAKSANDASRVIAMADLYDSMTEDDKDRVYDLMDQQRVDYFILDNEDHIVHQYGDNTCNLKNSVDYTDITITSEDKDAAGREVGPYNLKIFQDKQSGVLDPVFIATNEYDLKDLIGLFAKKSDGEDEEVIDVSLSVDGKVPYWMSADVKDGRIFCKGGINVDYSDMILMLLIVSTLAFMIFVVTLILLINVIVNFVDQKRMKKLLFMDNVTQDHNWMRFYIEAGELLTKRRNAKKMYAVVNLVFIKYRNFVLCHSVEEGEIELRKVYQRIRKMIGKKDLCGHDTSSNFALLLEFKDENELRMRIQGIINELSKINSDHKFTFQAGIDTIPASPRKRRDVDVDSLYNNACAARMTLDSSDESGIAFFNKKIVDEHKWVDKVHELQQKAIDNEEFVVYYQPKYEPKTEKLVGAEALIRWQSPELKFVSPGRFIPIFEENGFITEIDHYMLKHVARDQKSWMDEGMECVPVSVNVSRAHFIEEDLAEQIRDIVAQEGCPASLIEIELTESAFFDDKKVMLDTIARLKEYGFSVSMDDFGSGYSSLNSLKDLPLDVLKLDAGFFRDLSDDGRGEIVVSEAIKLAKSLHMKTVAEGVEEREQVEFLANEGCDMIQGFVFDKPMPGEEYQTRMTHTDDRKEEN